MRWVLIAVLLVACGDDKITAPEPEVVEILPTLDEQILGEWRFTLVSSRGNISYTVYNFTPDQYSLVRRNIEKEIFWSEIGLWQIVPSENHHVGTLIVHIQDAFNTDWIGFVQKYRLEIQDDIITIGGNNGHR